MSPPRIMLVDADVRRRSDLAFELESNHGYRVIPLGNGDAILEEHGRDPVAAVICTASLPEGDAISVLQQLPRHGPAGVVTVLLAEPNERGLRRLAWTEGVHAVLTEPVDGSELAAALRVLLERGAERQREISMRERLAASMDRLTDLLVLITDAAVPGSAHRGAVLSHLMTRMAAQFDLSPPLMEDLLRAARLHELGRFTLGEEGVHGPGRSPAGHCTMASALLLADVPYLQEAADLIEGIGANWDGTGIPPGRQRGQIPLRSRLLRIGVDLLAASERNAMQGDPSMTSAAVTLQAHAGRWYDPAALAALDGVLADERPLSWQEDVALITYDRLRPGMRLAADLHTVSGIKLLSAGTVLTAATLQLVRRRHEIDPLILPVQIHRRSV